MVSPKDTTTRTASSILRRLSLSKDGKLTLLTKEMTRPNGIAFSPDEKTLYVAQSDPAAPIWKKFPVKDDGTLGAGELFYDATENFKKKLPGLPDGWMSIRRGTSSRLARVESMWISPSGKLLGRISTGRSDRQLQTRRTEWRSAVHDGRYVLVPDSDADEVAIGVKAWGSGEWAVGSAEHY